MKTEVRCPNCNSSFVIGENGTTITKLSGGIHYLVPETIRNENVIKMSKVDERLKALEEAGIHTNKLRELMNGSSNFELEDLFDNDDPILNELKKGGFIRNPELFRRWITAQTFRLINNPKGWTYAVKQRYDIDYVFNQTKRELALQINLINKSVTRDKRYTFFTFESFKSIFTDLLTYNLCCDKDVKARFAIIIKDIDNYSDLLEVVDNLKWRFSRKVTNYPKEWLNCFKGAGAYYTLQNIIRTHGFLIRDCATMEESLKVVEDLYKSIIDYPTHKRRWDLMMSLLIANVKASHFELTY